MRRPRFLDYYRQFEEVSAEEESLRLRALRDERRAREIELAPQLDLGRLEWWEPPDPEIVNAATFALRRAINRYPEASGGPALEAVAARHNMSAERIAIGHGAAQLIQAAVRRLAAGGSLVVPWPSWPVLPVLAARTGARPVPVPCPDGLDPERVAAAVAAEPDARAVVVCSPNDPTGALVGGETIRALAEALGPGVAILLDEALVDFAGEDRSAVGLTDELTTLLVFRSFSKAWAMAGLRIGYVVGAVESADVLTELSPGLGVATTAQAAVAAALEAGGRPLRRTAARARGVAEERARLERLLAAAPYDVHPSDAHVVWLAHRTLDGADLAHALAEQRVVVAPGAEWGDARHVRVTLRDRAATERLASALRAVPAP